ncbi:hypothetical protein [Salirhabdus salicampi]|uniref:hypothetical protein n=1 Tax=Salirhabdus salicampi TaxID=476102 RepID=UPI0020C3F96F|nr:hypothetical protein [Salirhabdus salicampi]MCP8617909.1 hypothetical protein [Salirhabdus salicampi]
MKNLNFKKGIAIGTMVGLLLPLLEKENRVRLKGSAFHVVNQICFYRKQPSVAVHDLRVGIGKIDDYLDELTKYVEQGSALIEGKASKRNS